MLRAGQEVLLSEHLPAILSQPHILSGRGFQPNVWDCEEDQIAHADQVYFSS